MRKDETGEPCPETLGEYLDLCQAISPGSKAVTFLEGKIAQSPNGRSEIVIVSDHMMRTVLFPMLTSKEPESPVSAEADASEPS